MAKSILLVDDDAETRALLGLLSHIEAPDVILLDYKMPVMNGSQFLARKRWNHAQAARAEGQSFPW